MKLIHVKMNQRFSKQNGVISRACSKCGGDLGDRYGKQRYCTSCHAEYMRENRPKHSQLSPMARMKANARAVARVAQSRGFITQKPCEKCGSKNSQKHHDDYSKPLDVRWFCRPCHLKHHATSSACGVHPRSTETARYTRFALST